MFKMASSFISHILSLTDSMALKIRGISFMRFPGFTSTLAARPHVFVRAVVKRIVRCKFVAVHTMGFLGIIRSWPKTTPGIHLRRNGFNVYGVRATAYSTQMVSAHSLRNYRDKQIMGYVMRVMRAAIKPKVGIAAFVDMTFPQPTRNTFEGYVWVYSDLTKESLKKPQFSTLLKDCFRFGRISSVIGCTHAFLTIVAQSVYGFGARMKLVIRFWNVTFTAGFNRGRIILHGLVSFRDRLCLGLSGSQRRLALSF